MKGVDLFCTSPASTAICTAAAAVYRPTIRHGDRSSIERRPPHRHHLPRKPLLTLLPCSSQSMPIAPRPYFEKSRTSFSSASKQLKNVEQRRKSSGDICDAGAIESSTRYLLSDVSFADILLPESERLTAPVPVVPPVAPKPRRSTSSSEPLPSLSSSRSSRSLDQVVILRVSLHCRGCENKLKKHLAKIEGVTFFSIDMETKLVTIRGDITPLSILSSVSSVKYAQLWQSSPSSHSTWSA